MKNKILIILILAIIFPIILNKSIEAKDIGSYTEKEIYNILLIGKDGISQKNSRADTMIILTIDNKNKAIKLTSLARDTLVYIPQKKAMISLIIHFPMEVVIYCLKQSTIILS